MQTNSQYTSLYDYLDSIAAKNAKNHIGKAKIRPTTYFLPDQAEWISDDSPRKFCVKGRQFGWSDITIFRSYLLLAYGDRQIDTWATSRDAKQASLLLEDVAKWDRIMSGSNFGKNLIRATTQDCITFANGNRIHSLSSNPDAQAGKRGNRIIDEFALHEQQERLLSVAMPGGDWGGDIEIFSTPRGSDTLFHRMQMDIENNGNPKKFSFYKITLQRFLEQGGLFKIQCALPHNHFVQQMDEAEYFDFKRRDAIDEETFNQEYMCISADEAAAFLSHDLITAAEYQYGLDWEKHANESDPELYVGVDIGRDKDLTVIWLLEKSGSTFYTREIAVFDKQPFEKQEAELYELLALPQVKRCCIDQTGIGRQFTERAQQKFGKYKVEGITFTQTMKEDLAFPVRMAFEDRTIKIPNDPEIRKDLRAIKKEPTASGKIRFTADRSESGHSDRFWALALALHATKRKHQPLEITLGR
jgi:phage FluMu gp28-like protein